jgi:hypothetical protein
MLAVLTFVLVFFRLREISFCLVCVDCNVIGWSGIEHNRIKLALHCFDIFYDGMEKFVLLHTPKFDWAETKVSGILDRIKLNVSHHILLQLPKAMDNMHNLYFPFRFYKIMSKTLRFWLRFSILRYCFPLSILQN